MSWQKVKLGDFLTARTVRFKPDDNAITGLSRIDKIDFSGNIFLSNKVSNTDMILVQKGDLVISGINVAKGAMAVYQGDNDILATIHYSSYEFKKEKIDIDFLKYFLKSSAFKQNLQEQVPGGIKTEIKPKHLLPLYIEIPKTLDEQKKIVRVLNSNISQIDNFFLKQSHQILLMKKLRQQVLTDAITGKLTAAWRKKNKNIEPAIELLKRINSEKENPGKEKKGKKVNKLPSVFSIKIPFELPDEWTWCRLGEIISFGPTNGYSPRESKKGKGIKCLTLTATTSGFFRESCYKYVDETIPSDSYLWLKKNDILLQRGNSIDYVGIAAIYEGENNEYIYPDLMIKIQVSSLISPEYIHQVLISPFIREYLTSNASGAQKSMPKINQTIVLNTPIPLPPILEQQKIIEKLKPIFEQCKILKEEIEKQSVFSKDLLTTLFNETFKGS